MLNNNYYILFLYFPGKIVISPLTFVGSVIGKNRYLSGDKFTAKYSTNKPDLIVSIWKSLPAIGSSGFSPLVKEWLLLIALFKINTSSPCFIENSDGLKDTFPSLSSFITRTTDIGVESISVVSGVWIWALLYWI